MKNVNLAQQTVKGIKFSILSVIIKFFLSLGTFSILARLLTPIDFGIIGISMLFINAFVLISQFGLGEAIIYIKNLNENHIRTCILLLILLNVFSLTIYLILSPIIAAFVGISKYDHILQAMGSLIIIKNLNTVSFSLLRKKMKYKKLMISQNIAFFFGYCVIGVLLALLDFKVWALVLALISENLIFLLLNFKFHPYPFIPSFSKNEFYQLIKYGSGMTLSSLFNIIAKEGDYLIVAKLMDVSLAGIYERAYKLIKMPSNYLFNSINRVLFPSFSIIQNNVKTLKKIYLYGLSLIALIGIPISLFITIMAEEIILIILGNQWVNAVIVLKILSFLVFFQMNISLGHVLISSQGIVFKRAFVAFVYAVLIIFASIFGSRWGLKGVAIGVLFALFINFILLLRLCGNLVKIKFIDFLKLYSPILIVFALYTLILSVISINCTIFIHVIWVRLLVVFVFNFFLFILTVRYFAKFNLRECLKWVYEKINNRLPYFLISAFEIMTGLKKNSLNEKK